MIRLRGSPFGPGIAFGTASVIRATNGIPMLPARLLDQMVRMRRNEISEPVDVVLVAKDYASAASLNLPWANVVAILAEDAASDSIRRGVPTVLQVTGLMESVSDDDLILIDGTNGIALIDPDPTVIAAYQAQYEKIAPRRRIFLDYEHQPARTLDGREVRVLARISAMADIDVALSGGADGLYVPAESGLIDAMADDSTQLEQLNEIGQRAGGKPVTIEGDLEALSIASLMRASLNAEFTLAMPVSDNAVEELAMLAEFTAQVREDLIVEEFAFQDFQVQAVALPGVIGLSDMEGVVVGRVGIDACDPDALDSGETRQWFEGATQAAAQYLIPVEVLLPGENDLDTRVRTVLGLGASGVVVDATEVQAIKDAIRAVSMDDCRALAHSES
jgi:hypothetical protein